MKQYVFSAPGRTEISGNHTDHQHGCVLAASVNLRTTAQVALNDSNMIHILSEGYPTTVLLLLVKLRGENESRPVLDINHRLIPSSFRLIPPLQDKMAVLN